MIFIFIIEESCRDRHCDATRLELVVAASSTYVFREFTLAALGF